MGHCYSQILNRKSSLQVAETPPIADAKPIDNFDLIAYVNARKTMIPRRVAFTNELPRIIITPPEFFDNNKSCSNVSCTSLNGSSASVSYANFPYVSRGWKHTQPDTESNDDQTATANSDFHIFSETEMQEEDIFWDNSAENHYIDALESQTTRRKSSIIAKNNQEPEDAFESSNSNFRNQFTVTVDIEYEDSENGDQVSLEPAIEFEPADSITFPTSYVEPLQVPILSCDFEFGLTESTDYQRKNSNDNKAAKDLLYKPEEYVMNVLQNGGVHEFPLVLLYEVDCGLVAHQYADCNSYASKDEEQVEEEDSLTSDEDDTVITYETHFGEYPEVSSFPTVITKATEKLSNAAQLAPKFDQTNKDEFFSIKVLENPKLIAADVYEICVELKQPCFPGWLLSVKPQNSLADVTTFISSLDLSNGSQTAINTYSKWLTEQYDLSCERSSKLGKTEAKKRSMGLILSEIPRIQPRLYYLTGMVEGRATFNVRKLQIDDNKLGLATSYLSRLKSGDWINAKLVKDTKLPWSSSSQVVLITSDFGATALRIIWLNCSNVTLIYHITDRKSLLYEAELNELHKNGRIETLTIAECNFEEFLTQLDFNDLLNSVARKIRSGAHVYVTGQTDFCINLRALLSATIGVETVKDQSWYHEDNGAYQTD